MGSKRLVYCRDEEQMPRHAGERLPNYGTEQSLLAAKERADQLKLFRQRSKEVFQNGR